MPKEGLGVSISLVIGRSKAVGTETAAGRMLASS